MNKCEAKFKITKGAYVEINEPPDGRLIYHFIRFTLDNNITPMGAGTVGGGMYYRFHKEKDLDQIREFLMKHMHTDEGDA